MFARTLPPALVLTLAIMAGSSMDATIKWLAQTNNILLVTLGRYVFGSLFSLGIWFHAGRPTITLEMWRAHGLRGGRSEGGPCLDSGSRSHTNSAFRSAKLAEK